MANATVKKVLTDGWRNAVVQLSGVLDTSNATITPAITLADFTNNDPGAKALFSGFIINCIQYSIADQLQAQLYWNATTPELMVALAGRGKIKYETDGRLVPVFGAAGFNGSINLATTGWASGIQNYTILLGMDKLYR